MLSRRLDLTSSETQTIYWTQICARTENATMACYDDALYSIVHIESSKGRDKLLGHDTGECIVPSWSMQRENQNRCWCR